MLTEHKEANEDAHLGSVSAKFLFDLGAECLRKYVLYVVTVITENMSIIIVKTKDFRRLVLQYADMITRGQIPHK